MRQIQRADMAVAADAGVVGADAVRRDESNGRRPHEEAVLVVRELLAVIEVRVKAGRDRVAASQEILPKIIGDDHALPAPGEEVQLGVRFFFELIEDGDVPLVAIPAPRAEQP